MIQTVIWILATMTFVSDIFIVLVGVSLILAKVLKKKSFLEFLSKSLRSHVYHLTFLISFVATLGSLFFSEIAKFAPCILCWYQRIFMYPQVFMTYIAILRKEKVLTPYLIGLNTFGALIAGYHYFIQRFPKSSFINCEIGGAVSCTKNFTLHYGYITIPLMALTAFVLNLILLTVFNSRDQSMNKKKRT